MKLLFTHPAFLPVAGALALLALGAGLWAQARPGQGVRVVGQRPVLQGLGLSLVLAGLGLGLAEPRWGLPEVPRLTVHIILDASRSMLVQDCGGRSRWEAAGLLLDRLWSRPESGVQYSLDLLTGDTIPLVPPGEDGGLLRDALKAVKPGEIGSPGTSLGRGIPQIVATVAKDEPAVLLLVSDGEETWEGGADAPQRALTFLKDAKLPLYAVALGGSQPQPVPATPGEVPPTST
ncbi:MAG TPA: VWA domain-containing protein, partial [Holophaga sp.]|nr:VWA domain-containing protein [Holophaga sp.]